MARIPGARVKSRGDRFTSLQVLGYELAIWTQWRKDHPRARRLPPIVPIVVHHGRRPWRAPTSLLPLFDLRGLEPAAARALAALQPAFAFSLDDVSRCDDASLRRRDASPLAQLALASLRTLRGASVQATLTAIATWLDVVARALATPGGGERIDVLWSYVLAVSDVTDAQLRATVRPAGPRAEESVMSTAKRLHAKGKAEGRTEGHAELLLRQLDARFGPLPIAVVARVHAAPAADLERWAIAVLSAPTLAAVFATG